MIEFRLRDGSVYTVEDEKWIEALELKARDNGLNLHGDFALISEYFADQVERHWKNRTEPTKFRWDEEWEKEYQSQAELAEVVMYQLIRAPLMGILLSEASGGKSSVIAIHEDGTVTEYTAEDARRSRMDDSGYDGWLKPDEDEDEDEKER